MKTPEPDYASYQLEELFEAYASINRERFPERFQTIKDAIAAKQKGNYRCCKCDCGAYEASRLYTTTDRLFSREPGRFIAVSCIECGYTEFYRSHKSALSELVDFFIN